jgi:DNA polymerase III delta prime subunit
MKNRRPFTVLIIDDDPDAVLPLLKKQSYRTDCEYYFLELLKQHAQSVGDMAGGLQVLWSQTVDLTQTVLRKKMGPKGVEYEPDTVKECVLQVYSSQSDTSADQALWQEKPEISIGLSHYASIESLLRTVDVVVLDLGGLSGDLPDLDETTVAKTFKQAGLTPPSDLANLLTTAKTGYPGVYFYHANIEALKSTQFVAVLSVYDAIDPTSEPEVKTLLHRFCGLQEHIPYTVKFGKDFVQGEGPDASLHGRVQCLYQDYCEGYTQLRHLGQIEEAAHHNYPVLIVGESGTGKEYVARAIHRRWFAEMRRNDHNLQDNFVVVNCAGLSAELARSELFGHVAGSFTGATDHRVGAVLRACGCAGFRKTSTAPGELKDAQTQVDALATAVADMAAKQGQQKLEHFCSHVVRALNAAIDHQHNGLVTLLKRIRKDLDEATTGHDLVQDYYNGLLKKNTDHLDPIVTDGKQEDLGIKFKHNRPVGTLFLDEFGDLPPEVQNLLLRFLEEKSGEIQPVGYPGRIAGLKIRLILATSDRRIAAFAGYPLIGPPPSPQDITRSFRPDLLFRIKGQVIKTEAIATQAQLWASLEEMVARHSPYTWDEGAKKYLAGPEGEITKILNDFAQPPKGTSAMKAFGQRRELKRTIDLVNSYLDSAERRGLRLESDDVTEAILKSVWKPSELLMTQPVAAVSSAAAQQGTLPAASYDPLSTSLTAEEAIVRTKALEVLRNEDLLDPTRLQDHTQKNIVEVEARGELRDRLETAFGIKDAHKSAGLHERWFTLGRVFNYRGYGPRPPSSKEIYITQTKSWWSGGPFRNSRPRKLASRK